MFKTKRYKQIVDSQLLNSIVTCKQEWKKVEHARQQCVETTDALRYKEMLSKNIYMFLLKEARNRNLHHIRYH